MSSGRVAIIGTLVLVALVVGVAAGPTALAPGDVWRALLSGDAPGAIVVRGIRLPRVLLAFLIGGSLAVTGASLQALVRNPLAEPFLLGLSGGAGLGAVLAIASGSTSPVAVPLAAFAGALLAVGAVYRIAAVAGRRLDPNVLLLGGVVIGAFATALMSAVIAVAEAAELKSAFGWLLGGFGSASWRALAVFALWAAVPLAVLWWHARALDLLSLGDETAQYLGADAPQVRRTVFVVGSLLTAASVAVCGVIGFVGLVVPHAIRRLGAPLHRPLLPLAFLAGGAFLVLCDAAARTVVAPLELPVGVVTALVGVPLFAVLLRRTAT